MAVSPLVKPLGITAAVLAIVQGVVWVILSFLTILIHFEAWTPSLTEATYGQSLSVAILSGYVNGKVSLGKVYNVNVFIRPQEFYIWAIIYLVTSLFWIGFSSFLLYVLLKKKYDLLKKTLLGWVMWSSAISVCDLLLTSLLASDYDTLVTEINKTKVAQSDIIGTYSVLACGVMMTLAARGFALWIINVAFDAILIKFFIDMPKQVTENDMKIIDAFGATTSADDPSRPNLGRSNSFTTSTSFGTFNGLPRLPPIQSTNERLAKLGRHSVRSRSVSSSRPTEFPSYATSPEPSFPGTSQERPLKPALKRFF